MQILQKNIQQPKLDYILNDGESVFGSFELVNNRQGFIFIVQ